MNTKELLIERQKSILLELNGINDSIDERYNSWSNQVTTPARKFLETFKETDLIKSFTEKLNSYNTELAKSGAKYIEQAQLYDKVHVPVFKAFNGSRNDKIAGYRANALSLIEEFDINATIVYPALANENGNEKEPELTDESVFGRSADLNNYVPWAVGVLVAIALYKRFKK